MKKVLILSYYYPPVGGAGVQRTIKFVKYLRNYDYIPVVVAGTGYKISLPNDHELMQEISDIKENKINFSKIEIILFKVLKGYIGRWTLLSRYPWMRAAKRTISNVIERDRPDLLYVTTSPFYAANVAGDIAKKYSIPWVLDMRDPWALDPITQYQSKFHYYLEMKNMKICCQKADAVIMNTPSALHSIRKICHNIPSDKFYMVTNGWDSNDFKSPIKSCQRLSKPFKIIHTGVFHTKDAIKRYQKVNFLKKLKYSVSNINLLSRSPYYLFSAYKKLLDENKIPKDAFKFIFAGFQTKDDINLAKKFSIEKNIEFKGYLNHKESIDLLLHADVLFLPLHEVENGDDPMIIPGKTYEYLASHKPILACVPNGDTREFVQKSGLGFICDPTNIDQIAYNLNKIYTFLENGSINNNLKINNAFIISFERKELTSKLARIFDLVLNKKQSN